MSTNDSNNNYEDWRDERRRKWEERRAQQMAGFTHRGMYTSHHNPGGRFVIGSIILLLGILLLLENLGILYVYQLWQFWPVILVGAGIARIIEGRGLHSKLWGATVACVGLIISGE